MSIATNRNPYPLVPLGEILAKSEEWINILPDQRYRQVTVKMNGQGVIQRNEVAGGEIAADRRLQVHVGQFILSRIDARNGALGIVPPELDGAVVSNDFPAFNVNTARILPDFLGWMSRTPEFVELCKMASEGTTNRVRLQEKRFLSLNVPLPPLAEQRRLIARIEEIAAKIAKAQQLRVSALEETEPFYESLITSVIPYKLASYPTTNFGNLLTRFRFEEDLQADKVYNGVGTRMWGGGVYIHEQRAGNNFNAERYKVRRGQLVYNEVWAHNGAIGIVPSNLVDIVVSRHFHVFDVDWEALEPRYLEWIFRSPWFWHQCQEGSVGTSGRGHMRRKHLEQILLPLPPLPEQRRIVAELDALQAQVDALRSLQAETAAELDALLPAILDRAFRGEL